MWTGSPLVRPHAPSRERSVEALDLLEARLKWARGLTEMDLRGLASEYMMGKVDESTTDAFNEFCRRWPDEGLALKHRLVKQEAARQAKIASAYQSINHSS